MHNVPVTCLVFQVVGVYCVRTTSFIHVLKKSKNKYLIDNKNKLLHINMLFNVIQCILWHPWQTRTIWF